MSPRESLVSISRMVTVSRQLTACRYYDNRLILQLSESACYAASVMEQAVFLDNISFISRLVI